MYSFSERIRFSEADENGKISIASILNLFQDCAIFQSEDKGVGLDYMKELNMIWALSFWQIDVIKYPKRGERVNVNTVPYDFKSFLGYRSFSLTNENGETLAVANSVWSLLDVDTFTPRRFTDKMLEAYACGEPIPMDKTGRKIELPKTGEDRNPITVTPDYLDSNHHVNNGKYVAIAQSLLPQGIEIKRLRAEYKKQAFCKDVFYPMYSQNGDKYVITLNSADKTPYFIAEFTCGN